MCIDMKVPCKADTLGFCTMHTRRIVLGLWFEHTDLFMTKHEKGSGRAKELPGIFSPIQDTRTHSHMYTTLRRKATIHQVITMLAASKNVLFPVIAIC